MKMTMHESVGIINIGRETNFYLSHSSVLECTSHLRTLFLKKVQLIVFLQDSCSSRTLDRLPPGKDEYQLLEPMRRKIHDFRQLIANVFQYRHHFLFVGQDDCIGDLWELALACSQRIWFSNSCVVGFPAIETTGYPMGGILEYLFDQYPKSKEIWRDSQILSVQQAHSRGYLENMGDGKFLLDLVLGWLDYNSIIGENSSISVKYPGMQEPLDWFETITLGVKWRATRGIANFPRAWELGWQIHKSKKNYKEKIEYESLMSYELAKHLLGSLRQQHVSYGKLNNFNRQREREAIVYIDGELWAPPIEIFSSILQSGYFVVFYGTNSRGLAALLERMYIKLERQKNVEYLKSLWVQNVSWFSGECTGSKALSIRWNIGDTVEVFYACKKFHFLNLESNLFEAKKGYFEHIGPKSDSNTIEPVQDLLTVVCDGVIEEKLIAQDTPASTWARLMLLEELIKITRHREGDIDKLLGTLGQAGWRFSASSERWGYFLQTRRGSDYPGDWPVFPGKDVWNLGRWKQIYSLVNPIKKSSTYWSTPDLCNHLALYVYALSRYLHLLRTFECEQNTHLLVAESVGFPKILGSPKDFMQRWGLRRFELYMKHHWKKLLFDKTGSIHGQV